VNSCDKVTPKAFNRRSETFRDELRATCDEGVDVYFDTVGGPMLDVLRRRGRIAAWLADCDCPYAARAAPPKAVTVAVLMGQTDSR
jgi:NADPH-dependent curcumin reductase CurA